ncbi:MAG: tRNA pseudouridine(55) synthase TruB [Cytophagales bacterium]|nr:tRNA pseudouridine(55) synthase TruB [Cytophagales bacterium]MDW8384391.1 tRNA pseudouridine(55) synthase TruB [Flammeovirgaceae bacterium]
MPTYQEFLAGQLILVDKPLRWTSFDVVNKLRSVLKIKKIGHAGTLDPLATGLLLVCTGKMTKQIETFMHQEKEYETTIVIGKTTPSFDLETPFDTQTDWTHLTESEIRQVILSFQGEIWQVPPQYSAVKVNGKPAYRAARKGETLSLAPKRVTIYSLDILEMQLPEIRCRVICSKGTYIRSLARDIGQKLGVGAYLSSLRRTRIGNFTIDKAIRVEDFSSLLSTNFVD